MSSKLELNINAYRAIKERQASTHIIETYDIIIGGCPGRAPQSAYLCSVSLARL